MALPISGELPARSSVFRRFVLAASVSAAVAALGLGGWIYYRNNSPHQLAIKAQLALEQHDANRAIEYLTRALAKNPAGDALNYDRNLMAKAMIDAGREADARLSAAGSCGQAGQFRCARYARGIARASGVSAVSAGVQADIRARSGRHLCEHQGRTGGVAGASPNAAERGCSGGAAPPLLFD